MYEYRKKIAVFLLALMLMTVVTTQYTKTQVNASVETIVAPFVLDAVVKLLVVVSGAYLVDYINENYDMNLERSDVTQTITAVKTLFDIFRTTDGFKLLDKQTGEELNVSADTSSVAGHLITQTTPTDSHDREFYNWYMSNVSKKLGQYHMRVRQWSDTYSQYIDRYYAEDNPLDLYQYVPTQYQDDYLQLFADMQGMVKTGFVTNGYEKGFIQSQSPSFADLKPFIIDLGYQFNQEKDRFGFINTTSSNFNYMAILKYNYSSTLTMYQFLFSDIPFRMKYNVASGTFASSVLSWLTFSTTVPTDTVFDVITYENIETNFSAQYPYIRDYAKNDITNVLMNGGAVDVLYSESDFTDKDYNVLFPITNTGTNEEESSPVAFPLFPPVLDDSGNIALDHGDIQDVPVEEDQDGVPYVPDGWFQGLFDDYFGQVIPGEFDGSLTDMTELELLQEITNNTKKPNYGIVDGTAILELLKDKFGLFYQLYDFFKSILQADYSPEKPEFEVTFDGQLGVHGTYNILNLDWYDNNRSYIMLFITSTTWFFTGLKLFRRLPKAIET